MIAETRTRGFIDAIRRRFVDRHAGVTYEIPQYIDHRWELAYGSPLVMKGQNGELGLTVLNSAAYNVNLNAINDTVGFRITDPTVKAGIHVDFETGGINIPADEQRNPYMLYNLMNAIARMTYYQGNSQILEIPSEILSDQLETYSPMSPLSFPKDPMMRRLQLEMWRTLCNQEIDISLETIQLIKDCGLMAGSGLQTLDDFMLTVNSDAINRSLFQIPMNLEQIYEETGWNMEVPQSTLETYLYVR